MGNAKKIQIGYNVIINSSIRHECELFHIHKAEQTNIISIVLYEEQ